MVSIVDITIKLDGQDESFLTDIAHLILELNQDGRVVDKANLLSRESVPGVWDADEPLILRDAMGEFELSVSMQFDENDRQLVGSRELDGTELYDLVGTEYGIMTEIALQSHDNYPDIILRTNISTIAKLRELTSGAIQQSRFRKARKAGKSGAGNLEIRSSRWDGSEGS
ncbi:hypothetical protein CPB86DRAFT_792811 [Serendipita vermifera]|nr:hypothetical protein CPB86DRAFT_792811 [Serendipita vermifera]